MNKTRRYFGTDGIRGKVGVSPITPDFVLKLGWAAGKVFSGNAEKHTVLIGKDTRISSDMFESSLVAGFAAAGMNSYLLGAIPTPGVAYLTRAMHATAGVVISASHNRYHDNGIKFFSPDGMKLPDDMEWKIEQFIDQSIETASSKQIGRVQVLDQAQRSYIEFCKSSVPNHLSLQGVKIVLDCAHGAAYEIAPAIFKELGAEVIEIGVSPDGFNINAGCGATDTRVLQETVIAEQADVGIALDGDGDRIIMVDHKGEAVDGDELLFVFARYRQQKGALQGGVVGTLMSNVGLELAFNDLSIPFIRSKVGDRYVLEKMLSENWSLGGESSGHIIALDLMTTGDGIITALQVLIAMIEKQQSLHALKSGMQKFPQVLVNVVCGRKVDLAQSSEIQAVLKYAEASLKQQGRVLLRPSGTEPVIRVMVEGRDILFVKQLADEIAQVVENALKA
ncbi:MAG: phosphoglucosamine mutase [Pseudomonadota bacterium]|nr:phosphoglucosamine mutase [Gammaproteobacteria bacterium]MBU1559134.1 phosphoglucosamine mutase [Gammaproteobacteria bacterium]MBU1926501.1 phosphoglucosamine mutase [Gammaproteobacteria bacterium]MBU2546285.1 phosphoglucosamine mutase [Gammaproteobacteria bacterium]